MYELWNCLRGYSKKHIASCHMMLSLEALSKNAAEALFATEEDCDLGLASAEKINECWDKWISEADKPLPIQTDTQLYKHPGTYDDATIAILDDKVHINWWKLWFVLAITGAESAKWTGDPEGAIVFYTGEIPVAILMPMKPYELIEYTELPTIEKAMEAMKVITVTHD